MVLEAGQGNDGNKWYKVKFDVSGAEGWIESRFIKFWNIEEELELALEEKANAAKLSYQQVNKLLALDKSNPRGIELKIVLPTYIPIDFEAEITEINEYSIAAPSYTVGYFNKNNNSCFEISAASGGFGAAAEDFEIIMVNSKALGSVELGFTQFDNLTNQPRIGFHQFTVPGIIPSQQQYSFWSPVSNAKCNAISFQEAAKIVESLGYLNP